MSKDCICVTCWKFETWPSHFGKPPRLCCGDFTGENSFPKKTFYVDGSFPKVKKCKAYMGPEKQNETQKD